MCKNITIPGVEMVTVVLPGSLCKICPPPGSKKKDKL